MFLDDGRWESLEDVQRQVAELVRKLDDPRERALFRREDEPSGPIRVTRVRRRDLPFYRNFDLYEFQVDLASLGLAQSHSSGAVYALLSPTNARLLNGQSPVIHETNASFQGGNGDRVRTLILNEGTALDYLLFFCCFVAGEEGPFMVMETVEDLL